MNIWDAKKKGTFVSPFSKAVIEKQSYALMTTNFESETQHSSPDKLKVYNYGKSCEIAFTIYNIFEMFSIYYAEQRDSYLKINNISAKYKNNHWDKIYLQKENLCKFTKYR